MGKPLVLTCCSCYSLRTGTIISGVIGVLLAIINIILVYTTRAEFKTIIMDWLPSWLVKIIITINLVMTILLSLLLIIGAVKVNIDRKQKKRETKPINSFFCSTEKSLSHAAMGRYWNYLGRWIANLSFIYSYCATNSQSSTCRSTMDHNWAFCSR